MLSYLEWVILSLSYYFALLFGTLVCVISLTKSLYLVTCNFKETKSALILYLAAGQKEADVAAKDYSIHH
jgi:hypothetical protein